MVTGWDPAYTFPGNVIDIPESVSFGSAQYQVTEIRYNAFQDNNTVVKIIVPKTVTSIRSGAFNYCDALEDIEVSADNEEYVGIQGILYSDGGACLIVCPDGKEGTVTVSKDVTIIDSDAFRGNSLTEINVESGNAGYSSEQGILYDGTDLFSCPGKKSGPVIIPDGIERVDGYAFYGCSLITSVKAPISLAYIGQHAFCNSSVTEAELPSVSDLSNNAFEGCTALEKVSVPAATVVGHGTFKGCTALETVEMSNVTEIGRFAFHGCTKLPSVNVPEATFIDCEAFRECTALVNATVPKATEIGHLAFFNCVKLTSVDVSKATAIGNNAFYGCVLLGAINLPEATFIDYDAFSGCTALKTVTALNLEEIDERAFYGCALLDTIDLSNVTSVGNSAFSGCEALETANMPSVKSIGVSAFHGCTKLKTIDVSRLVTLGGSAFYGTALTAVSMPEATFIGEDAFHACNSLVSAEIPSATSIEPHTFYGCTALKTVKIPNVITVGNSAFRDCTLLEMVIMPRVTSVGTCAFYQCALSSLDVPELMTIGNSAFSRCNFVNIDLPQACTLGDYAFYGCDLLETAKMPLATVVGDHAFYSCDKLLQADIPSATHIGNYAFYLCAALKTVYMPSATVIGEQAFANCLGGISLTFSGGTVAGNALLHAKVERLTLVNSNGSTIGNLNVGWYMGESSRVDEIMFDSSVVPDVSCLNSPLEEGKRISFSYGTPNPESGNDMRDPDGNPITDRKGFTFSSKKVGTEMRWTKNAGDKPRITIPALPVNVYDRGEKTVAAPENSGYSLSGQTSGTAAGTYNVTAALSDKTNTVWSDGTVEDKTLTWTILPAHMASPSVTVVGPGNQTFSGGQLKPTVDAKQNGTPLGSGDLELQYGANLDAGDNAGSVVVRGLANYTGSVIVTFTIDQREISDGITVTIESQVYTGSAIEPSIDIKLGTVPLVRDKDYYAYYSNNSYVTDEAAVRIDGIGNFKGEKTWYFKITPKTVTITPLVGQSKVYGPDSVDLGYWSEGMVDGKLWGSLGWDGGDGAGLHKINLGTLDAGPNYVLVLGGDVDFRITKKPITIYPNSSQSKVYGDGDPELRYSHSPSLAYPSDSFTGALGRDEERTSVFTPLISELCPRVPTTTWPFMPW